MGQKFGVFFYSTSYSLNNIHHGKGIFGATIPGYFFLHFLLRFFIHVSSLRPGKTERRRWTKVRKGVTYHDLISTVIQNELSAFMTSLIL